MGTANDPSGLHIDTLAVHAGEPAERVMGSAVFPIFQSATFSEYDGDCAYLRPADTPNHQMLGAKLAALEGTEAAVVTSSGMVAISSSLMALLRPGDHLLVQAVLYGGTYEMVHHELQELGISHTIVDSSDPTTWEAALQPTTKVFYIEAMSNPLTGLSDVAAVARFCTEKGFTSVIDATFATPVLLRPRSLGIDVVLHSATKYLNGHSDLLAGVVCGTADFVQKVRQKLVMYGGVLDPHACFLLHRGLRTLGLRVRQQNTTAAALAEFLEKQPQVGRVFYPGLPSSAYHDLCQRLYGGRGGGVFSFELKGDHELVDRFLKGLTIPLVAPSLGGVETLVTVPSLTSHLALGLDARKAAGIAEGLIRVSVGVEATEDLIADFQRALQLLPDTAA